VIGLCNILFGGKIGDEFGEPLNLPFLKIMHAVLIGTLQRRDR
jgi:hypothetical protein